MPQEKSKHHRWKGNLQVASLSFVDYMDYRETFKMFQFAWAQEVQLSLTGFGLEKWWKQFMSFLQNSHQDIIEIYV